MSPLWCHSGTGGAGDRLISVALTSTPIPADGEGLQPRFGGFRDRNAVRIRESKKDVVLLHETHVRRYRRRFPAYPLEAESGHLRRRPGWGCHQRHSLPARGAPRHQAGRSGSRCHAGQPMFRPVTSSRLSGSPWDRSTWSPESRRSIDDRECRPAAAGTLAVTHRQPRR